MGLVGIGEVQQIAKVLQQAKLTLEKPQTTINLPRMNLSRAFSLYDYVHVHVVQGTWNLALTVITVVRSFIA